MFNGRRVQQLADQVDARRVFEPSGVLPLRRIDDEHAFEECMTLGHCGFDDLSAALRRKLLNAVGERQGLTLTGFTPGVGASEPGSGLVAIEASIHAAAPCTVRGRGLVTATLVLATFAVAAVARAAAWTFKHREPAPLVATVVSTSSPAQTLRELASSVPDDRQPYRVSGQIEAQSASTAAAQ